MTQADHDHGLSPSLRIVAQTGATLVLVRLCLAVVDVVVQKAQKHFVQCQVFQDSRHIDGEP